MTLDSNELRRLAQAATSGEWYVERGNYICGRIEVTDGEEEWHPVIACTDDDETNVDFEANAAFIAAANPAAVSELLDRLEAAESARRDDYQNWMTALDRNAELLAKLEAAEKERDELRKAVVYWQEQKEPGAAGWRAIARRLRAKVEAMERQEPVGWQRLYKDGSGTEDIVDSPNVFVYQRPLYALPGAKGD